MATVWGTADVVIAISPASLADWVAAKAARQSTVIDISGLASGPFSDLLIFGQSKTVAGTIGNQALLAIYAYGTTGGTTYPDAVTGTDGAITTGDPINLPRIGIIRIPTANTSFKAGPFSLRAGFAGTLPSKGGIVLVNMTNLALSATPGDHVFYYQATP